MDMGAKIHLLRTQNDMTLEELGNKVGVGKSTVRKWENGIIANMKRDKILKVAEALNTSPAYLMGWSDSTESLAQEKILEIMSYYEQLNDLGKGTATEQVRLLTLDKKYTTTDVQPFPTAVQEPEPDYLKVNAAQTRTDRAVTQEELDHDEYLIQEYFRNKEKSDL